MAGSKNDVLEVEELLIAEDSRGFVFHNDATNFLVQSASPSKFSGCLHSSTSVLTTKACLPTASSMGWLKIHYISGSTYGATGAACYIPVFRNLNINTA